VSGIAEVGGMALMGRESRPNKGVQATAYGVRSTPASRRG
jgi:hypothetical protein